MTDQPSSEVIFTQNAAKKVWELIQEDENPNLKLRAYITGGGCSGFQYGFTFDEERQEDDLVVNNTVDDSADSPSVSLLIDPLSLMYLTGAEIDYVEDISGAQFVIRNPNAVTTCGCGSSFAVS